MERVEAVEREDFLWFRNDLIQNNAQLCTGLPVGSEYHTVRSEDNARGGREGRPAARRPDFPHNVLPPNILTVRSWIQRVPRSIPAVRGPIWRKVSFFQSEKATPPLPECVL